MDCINGKGVMTADVLAQELNKMCRNGDDVFYQVTRLQGEDLIIFKKYLKELKRLATIEEPDSKKNALLNKEKGTCLEELVLCLMNGTSILQINSNIRTATNEIDLLVSKRISADGMRDLFKVSYNCEFDDYFICECKNHNKPIGSTWIGKFYTLMSTCNSGKLGLFFSYHGLTGSKTGWTDAHGLTKVIRSTKKDSIIEFNINDYDKMSAGVSFFKLLRRKVIELPSGADFKTLGEHENIEKLQHEIKSQFQ